MTPKRVGLYNPRSNTVVPRLPWFVDMHGRISRDISGQGDHRPAAPRASGAQGAEPRSGDGAGDSGSDEFLREAVDFELPAPGSYAAVSRSCRDHLKDACGLRRTENHEAEGLQVLGWRSVHRRSLGAVP